jgi:hypothetical protein
MAGIGINEEVRTDSIEQKPTFPLHPSVINDVLTELGGGPQKQAASAVAGAFGMRPVAEIMSRSPLAQDVSGFAEKAGRGLKKIGAALGMGAARGADYVLGTNLTPRMTEIDKSVNPEAYAPQEVKQAGAVAPTPAAAGIKPVTSPFTPATPAPTGVPASAAKLAPGGQPAPSFKMTVQNAPGSEEAELMGPQKKTYTNRGFGMQTRGGGGGAFGNPNLSEQVSDFNAAGKGVAAPKTSGAPGEPSIANLQKDLTKKNPYMDEAANMIRQGYNETRNMAPAYSQGTGRTFIPAHRKALEKEYAGEMVKLAGVKEARDQLAETRRAELDLKKTIAEAAMADRHDKLANDHRDRLLKNFADYDTTPEGQKAANYHKTLYNMYLAGVTDKEMPGVNAIGQKWLAWNEQVMRDNKIKQQTPAQLKESQARFRKSLSLYPEMSAK